MGKKSFIKKGEGQKFFLLHRSQTDAAYAKEGVPSDFVLVPAPQDQRDGRHVHFGSDDGYDQSDGVSRVANGHHTPQDLKSLFKRGDHINEYGFKNDGYDYSKHLKPMGGGKFISRGGQVYDMPYARDIELPDDVLPSVENELDRNFEAIAISEKYMDPDVYASLFEDGDEEGAFEELDDDFVAQVMAEPEVPDFDFDAHIAKLIAMSQRDIEYVAPRKWAHEDDGSNGDEEEEDDEATDGEPVGTLTAEQRELLESQFEKTLGEYGDENLGDLAEADEEEEIEGYIDFDEGNEFLEAALDEFLNDQQEELFYEGAPGRGRATRARRASNADKQQIADDEKEEEEADAKAVLQDPIFVKQAVEEQLAEQAAAEATLREIESLTVKESEQDIYHFQEYLREEKKLEKWDCETILSTYSTLDNHPAVIREPGKFKPHQSRFSRATEAAELRRRQNLQQTDVMLSGQQQTIAGEVSSSKQPPQMIVLSGKLMLPKGFAPGDRSQSQKDKVESVAEKSVAKHGSGDDSDSDSESNSEGDNGVHDGDKGATTIVRSRKETAEEKKLRKAAAKQAKKEKRTAKKQLKIAYKEEGVKINKMVAKQQDIDHAHVFRYTAH